MHTWALLVSIALPLVAAQSNGDLGLKAIEAHFNQSLIVPDFLAAFNPTATLDVNYGAGNIQPGQKFTSAQVGSAPTLTVQGSTTLSGQYTLAMIDAEVPGSKLPQGANRHWLVTGVTIGQDSTVNNATGTAITSYMGPGPASGSGPHRYVLMVYSQPSDFAPPAEFNQTGLGVTRMDWNAFVTGSHLGDLIAANYIQVEEGTATVSVASTSSVVTSTLAPASTTASGPASASSSTSSKPSNGAMSSNVYSPLVMGLAALSAFFFA